MTYQIQGTIEISESDLEELLARYEERRLERAEASIVAETAIARGQLEKLQADVAEWKQKRDRLKAEVKAMRAG